MGGGSSGGQAIGNMWAECESYIVSQGLTLGSQDHLKKWKIHVFSPIVLVSGNSWYQRIPGSWYTSVEIHLWKVARANYWHSYGG